MMFWVSTTWQKPIHLAVRLSTWTHSSQGSTALVSTTMLTRLSWKAASSRPFDRYWPLLRARIADEAFPSTSQPGPKSPLTCTSGWR